jgi:hypothetical protein
MDLAELKEGYSEVEKIYSLPSFNELDENFEISKIESESDTLIKFVRKTMMDKVLNSLNFIEMLLNPMNAPRMYLGYLKNLTEKDSVSMEKIYSEFSELSILSLEREIDYDEKLEAELIKRIFEKWNFVKPDFRQIFASIKLPRTIEKKTERSYFG